MIRSDAFPSVVRVVGTVMCLTILATICDAQTSEPPPGRRVIPVSMAVTPSSTAIQAGQTVQFAATVTGTGNQKVSWSLSPVIGTISLDGLYAAPATVSTPTSVTVIARSLFDPTRMVTAAVVVNPNVGLTVTPGSAAVRPGQSLQLTAAVSGSTNQSVAWSLVSGVGSVSASGLYTAPSVVNAPVAITVKATSLADGSKSALSALTVNPDVAVAVTPGTGSVSVGGTVQLTAAVTGSANTGVVWSLNPAMGSISQNGLYTAPATVSVASAVTVTATSAADGTKKGSSVVTVNPGVAVSVTPGTGSVSAGGSVQLTAAVTGSANTGVVWSLSPAMGSISQNGLYTAPVTLSAMSMDTVAGAVAVSAGTTVTVTATSVADGTKKGSSVVTVNPGVAVSVTPGTATVSAGGTVQLTAAVTGSANTGVVWSLNPAMGSISQNGLYTAPATVSVASAVTVTATSAADGTKKATSMVTVNPGVAVSVTPSSATLETGRTLSLTATVVGTTNTAVTWALTTATGTLSTSGNVASYAAPASLTQSATVEVRTTSVADPMKFSTALITILPLATLSLAPAATSVKAGKTQQFQAAFSGTATQTVNWTIEPAGVGTITSSGLYTAPLQVAAMQRIKVKATSMGSPVLTSTSDVEVLPDSELTYTLNNNGLDTVIYNGVDYNYKYGEGLVQSVKYGEASTFLYGPPCSRALNNGIIEHNCVAGPTSFRVTARHFLSGPSTLSVDLTVTNQSATERLRDVTFSVLGIKIAQYDSATSRTGLVNSNNPVGFVNYVQGRYFYWMDTPSSQESINTACGWSYLCKTFVQSFEVAPGETRTIRISARYTENMTGSQVDVAPEAYKAYSEAFPMSVQWPDRRPIMAWWIAEGTKRSAINPRGYFQDPLLNVSDSATFRSRAMAQATRIRDLMKARPVQPQGLIVWDLEGQEFIHPTTYIGDPRVFSSGYAAEMDAVVDDVFKTFRDAGYRVGVTVRPQSMQWGTELPPSCTYDVSHDFKSYYIKVDNSYGQRFHACYDSGGVNWSVIPEGNGGQTIYKPNQIREVTELLKSKISYAYKRWGATLFYIDSAVWSGGRPLEASILRELQQTFPDILLIPEQESMETLSTGIPYSDSRIPDAKFAPVTWRWAFPTGAFAVAIGDCQGTCWQNNLSNFQVGQKIGDIAIYAQPTQMSVTHLPLIESMIQQARQESSTVTVTDSASTNVFPFRGDVASQKPYPVKLRVYFAASEADMASSELYCEAGQWMGENSCTLNLDGKSLSEIRYYDFTNQLVYRSVSTPFR